MSPFCLNLQRVEQVLELMSGVYIHIPFCRQACIYCNFHFKNGKQGASEMIEALLMEIDVRFNKKPFVLETLYFGGGTPSFLAPDDIKRLIDKVLEKFDGDHPLEITLEANPDDMVLENLQAWKAMGITRFSVGVQSFFDEHLKWMNRAHSSQEAEQALKLASEMGFDLSLDLIFGIPGSTPKMHLANLEKALTFNVQHLSCYGLTLEDNTPWKKLVNTKSYPTPDDKLAAEEFELTMNFMAEAGWVHYEISNYSKPGKMAIHNTSYWKEKHYIGIGPSAHSYDGNTRSWNIADNNAYVQTIKEGKLPLTVETLGASEKFNEYIMTGLRTMWGIDKLKLNSFGVDNAFVESLIVQFEKKNWIKVEGNNVKLTREGKFYADSIASDFFV